MVKGHIIKSIFVVGISALLFIVNSSARFTPVIAAETTTSLPKISEIYPNGPGASELGTEFIELFNPSNTTVSLASYKLQIKDKPNKAMNLSGEIPPNTYMAFITTFALLNSGEAVQLIHAGSTEQVIEEVLYGGDATEQQSWSYFTEGWDLTPVTKSLPNQRYAPETPPIDICPVTPEVDISLPSGYILDGFGICVREIPIQQEECLVEISELSAQPNYNGSEYLEFINTSNVTASLNLCKIKINTGAEKSLADIRLAPGARYVYAVTNGTIKNSAGEVILVRSDSQELLYVYPTTVNPQVVNYENGSLSGTVSEKPTPGAINEAVYYTEEEAAGVNSSADLSSCGSGKYRNPETNRCKNIESAESTLAPCASDQERNPATNRCRKATLATATLTPCNADQERNPETNRCRKIGTSSDDLKPCESGQERNQETNRCRKIANTATGSSLDSAASSPPSSFKYKIPLIIFLTTTLVGYGMYEYRTDIKNYLQKVRQNHRRGRPPG
jgi:hypothetical protein